MRKIFSIALVWLISSTMLQAQFYEFGLGGGGTMFHGDVGAVGFNATGANGFVPHQAFGTATLRRQFNWHWGTRLSYSAGHLQASDSWSTDDFKQNRDISVRTEVAEISYLTEFNFWPYGTGTKYRQSFYIFAGLGITAYNPQGFWQEEWVDLRPLGTEGQQTELKDQLFYGNTTITLPFGMGFRQSIARDWSMTAEVGWRRYGSDYLDDTSGDYVDAAELLELRGEQAAYFSNPGNVAYVPGVARGNANIRDWSIFAGITIFYNLSPRDERCSAF